jgi:hypothetical protein
LSPVGFYFAVVVHFFVFFLFLSLFAFCCFCLRPVFLKFLNDRGRALLGWAGESPAPAHLLTDGIR